MSEAMSEFIRDPQEYADSGFDSSRHLAVNLMTVFGWDEVTAVKIAEALLIPDGGCQ